MRKKQSIVSKKRGANSVRSRRKRLARQLAAYSVAAGAGVLGADQATAAVVPIQLPGGPVVIGNNSQFDLDIDGDLNDDFRIAIDYLGALDISGLIAPNGIAGSSDYLGVFATVFSAGELIDDYLGFYDVAALDNFVGTLGFVGVNFDIPGGSPHFAYLDLGVDSGRNEVTLYGGAYESEANTGIETGAVPEPGSLSLLAMGAAGMATWRRKRTDSRS